MLVGDQSTVPLTWILCNTVFSKSQNVRKAGTLYTRLLLYTLTRIQTTSCLTTAWQFLDHCFTNAWWLPHDFLKSFFFQTSVHLLILHSLSFHGLRLTWGTKYLTLTNHIKQSTNASYWLENQLFFKRSQYIGVKNPLHKRPTCASKRDRLSLATINYIICENLL